MTAAWEGREAEVSFCEDLDASLEPRVLLAGTPVLLASVTDVRSDPAAFPWMLFGKIPVLQSREVEYDCTHVLK